MNDPGPVRFTVRAPATSANIGRRVRLPGADARSVERDDRRARRRGRQRGAPGRVHRAPPHRRDEPDRAHHAASLRQLQVPRPRGLQITCTDSIPPASGLGSSSSAQALGLMAAGAVAGQVLEGEELLRRLAVLEGHADNVAAVALGGLVLVAGHGDDYIWRSYRRPAAHGRRRHAAEPLLDHPGTGAAAAGRAALRRRLQHGPRAAHHRGAAGRRPRPAAAR